MSNPEEPIERLDPRTHGSSTNVVEQNLEAFRQLFPDAFRESSDENGTRWRIDLDALRNIVGEYGEDVGERYSFNWNGKARARRIAQTPSTGTLRPCPEESINWDTTQNLFIEGDNLEVLKLLQKAYHKRVKVIYIDPPYNTGNEFIYPDKYQDNLSTYLKYTGQIDDVGFKLSPNAETSGRYHTNWLNMMYPRLKLARNLLADDGVIFISIDDHEFSNLRHICDEVFGEEHFVAAFKWNNTSKAPTLSKKVRGKFEYVLCYEKNDVRFLRGPDSYNTMAPLFNSGNPRTRVTFQPHTVEFQFADGKYKIGVYGDGDKSVELHDTLEVVDGKNANAFSMTARFKWSQATCDERIAQGQRLAFKTATFTTMYYYLDTNEGKFIAPSDLLSKDECEVLRNDEGYTELKELFDGSVVFDYVKPISLPKYLCRMVDDPEAIVLDFFAGAATTAHAVMQLNSEEGSRRRFILIQLPEPCGTETTALRLGMPTVADIAKERLRRAGREYRSVQTPVSGDFGFRVFKLDSSNIHPWDAEFEMLTKSLFNSVENIKPDRSESDVLYELLLKFGLDLAVPIEERTIAGRTVFIIGAGALVVSLADDITLEVVEGIAALKDELQPEVMRVVLKDAGFKDDVVKTNAVQILRQRGIEDVKSL